ncbi:MAG TPA: extracellular solute-binding protein, partial [Bacilli bacterium]
MKRNVGIVLILTLVLLTIFGCSKGSNKTEPTDAPTATKAPVVENTPAPEPKEKRKIVLLTIAGYYTTALKEAAADYAKLRPETEVVIDIISDNAAYKATFDSKMAAGGKDAPDIIHTNLLGDLADNIDKGWVLNLSDFANEPNEYNGGKTVFEGIDPAYHQYSYDRNGRVGTLTFDLVGTGFFYNKDIFDKEGLKEPTTWEELLEVAAKLKAANYIPLSMPILYEGWMHNAFVDWSSRSLYPEMLILPGDARYDEAVHKRNTEIKYDANADFDFGAVYDPEKQYTMVSSGRYDNQGPAEKKFWTLLKDLSQFYQPGYKTTDDPTVYSLFISQKAAMLWNGSWQVGSILADQAKMGDKAFKWGTFKFPDFAQADPLFPGKARGILVPGHLMGVTDKKDEEQANRAKDFLKYMYSKDAAQKIFERTLEVGEFVQGPSLVLGVTLPD